MKSPLARSHLPLVATTIVCAALYVAAAWRYPGFGSWAVFVNFFSDNAVLGLTAVGMTFVILSGGIDLSVGALVGLSTILIAHLTTNAHWHPLLAVAFVLALGVIFGAGQGLLIDAFRLPAFLITLAGLFLARGLAFIVSLESLSIRHDLYTAIDTFSFRIAPLTAVLFLAVFLAALYVLNSTPFGRAVYALGGSESSALLMGLPVRRTRVAVYALSGFCAALAGVAHTFYTAAGNATAGSLLELDAIAAVVIGGTLLSGGIGHVFGTLIGVLIYGIIQTAIAFDGRLSSWWTRIAIGILLLVFILLQKLVQRQAAASQGAES